MTGRVAEFEISSEVTCLVVCSSANCPVMGLPEEIHVTVLPDGWDIGPVSPEIGARLQTEQSSGARIWEFSLPAPDGQSYQVTFAYDAPPDYAIAWGTFELSGAYETSEGGTYDISFSGAWDAYVEYEITLSKFTYLLAGSLNSQKTGQSVYEVVNGEFLARGFLEP